MDNTCRQCGTPTLEEAKYCGNCGALLDASLEYSDPFKSKKLIWIFIYYGVILLTILIFQKFEVFHTPLIDLFVTDAIFLVLTIYVAVRNAEELKPLLKLSEIQIIPFMVIVFGAVIFSTFINIVVPSMNRALFGYDSNFYYLFRGSAYPVMFMFLSLAVLPAVLEEMAFRGFIFNNLLSFTSKSNTLVITSILFSILHLSFISLFWLLPFAFILGWIRMKYHSIWYGIAAHFSFNTITCIILLYRADVI